MGYVPVTIKLLTYLISPFPVEDFDIKAHQRTFQSEDSPPLEDSSEFTLEEVCTYKSFTKTQQLSVYRLGNKSILLKDTGLYW